MFSHCLKDFQHRYYESAFWCGTSCFSCCIWIGIEKRLRRPPTTTSGALKSNSKLIGVWWRTFSWRKMVIVANHWASHLFWERRRVATNFRRLHLPYRNTWGRITLPRVLVYTLIGMKPSRMEANLCCSLGACSCALANLSPSVFVDASCIIHVYIHLGLEVSLIDSGQLSKAAA